MKTPVTSYRSRVTAFLWRWMIRKLRLLMDAADDWLHAQEITLRESLATIHQPLVTDLSVDPKASRVRERAIKKTARAARPRLRYQGGQFVRVA